MFKKSFCYCLSAIVLSSVLFVACEKEVNEIVITPPSITVSSVSITATSAGGGYNFTYTINNPADDGQLSCSAAASWISDVTDTGSGISFNVSANTTGATRTGQISLSYSSSYGSASKTVTVAQNCDALPVLSVQPTAVAADIEGGTYSFTYTITNPADDGELTCSSTSSWITDFSVGASSVSFSVAENTGTSMRTGTISVYYTYGNGSLAETVTVVQDHEGGSGGGGGDYSDILGTYTASGLWYVDYDEATERAIVEQTTWTIIISANGSSGIYIQGMTPNISTYYLTESLTFATATVNSFGQIVIPSQMWSVTLQEGYYTGYTPCTEYDEEEGFYYGDGYSYNPDCTFTYDSATDTWESDYGMFVAAYSSTSFSSFAGFFDVVAPTIKLTKVSSSTSAVSTKSVSHPIDEGLKLNVNFKLHK